MTIWTWRAIRDGGDVEVYHLTGAHRPTTANEDRHDAVCGTVHPHSVVVEPDGRVLCLACLRRVLAP